MSGRRAKQRRRLVRLATSGDRVARAFVVGAMTGRQYRRAVNRIDAMDDRRERTPDGPATWDAAKAARERAKDCRSKR